MILGRCYKCQDSGKMMGNGMALIKCPLCYPADIDTDSKKDKVIKADKRSKLYKDSIEKIMKIHGVDQDSAVDIFDSEFDKLC